MSAERDTTPAVGSAGAPGPWVRPADAPVALHARDWRDGRWSYLFKGDTEYAPPGARDDGRAAAAARRQRGGPEVPGPVVGPVVHEPVWTWEIPVYFWLGGMAAGSSFVALACELAGDQRSARIARRTALGAVVPCPVLLILDLGRPLRFLNMLRVFKPRSPMNTGAWCLVTFSGLAAGSVALDALRAERAAAAVSAANAVVGGYLGSYTGVLLATTAVPVWDRSRLLLGPIFVATGTATGAAATHLALIAAGMPQRHPTRRALARVQAGAIATELALSSLNERRLGDLRPALERGTPGRHFRAARRLVQVGLAAQYGLPRGRSLASLLYLLGALLFRFAWVGAGRQSARDDAAVAMWARARIRGGARATARR